MQIYPYEIGYGYKPDICLAPRCLAKLTALASILVTIGKAQGAQSIRRTLPSAMPAVCIRSRK